MNGRRANGVGIALTVVLWTAAAWGFDYHFHTSGDDRTGDGIAAESFASVERANKLTLRPGDRLLFAGGQAFVGKLVPTAEDAGAVDRSVVVGSYGKDRATLQAGQGDGILVHNAGGVRIENVVVRGSGRDDNRGSGAKFLNDLPKLEPAHTRTRPLTHGPRISQSSDTLPTLAANERWL